MRAFMMVLKKMNPALGYTVTGLWDNFCVLVSDDVNITNISVKTEGNLHLVTVVGRLDGDHVLNVNYSTL